jgi:hypothetical protein
MIKFPISKICIEGPDLAGKSSLYNSIHKKTGFKWNIDDRSTLSMCVYANQYDRDDFYLRQNLSLELSNLNNHIVLLHPDLNVIHDRFLDRGDEFQDADSLVDLHYRFTKEFEKICMFPNVHVFTSGTAEEQTNKIVSDLHTWEKRTPSEIGHLVNEFAKFSPNRECTTTQFHFYDDGKFEDIDDNIESTPGEEAYYSKIHCKLLGKIKDEQMGINEYKRKETNQSRRFVYTGDDCISFIQIIVRDKLMDVHAVFRSSDTENKTSTDIQFIHYLGREAAKMLRLNTADYQFRFRININSAHII